MTTLYRDTALLIPPCIGIPPYSDRLASGYRLTQTALCRGTVLLRPPYIGIPPYSHRLISLYPLLRPPCIGIPSYSGRLMGGTSSACVVVAVIHARENIAHTLLPLRPSVIWRSMFSAAVYIKSLEENRSIFRETLGAGIDRRWRLHDYITLSKAVPTRLSSENGNPTSTPWLAGRRAPGSTPIH